MKLRSLFVCAVVCLLALPMFAADTVTPGKWQVSVEMEMVGIPHKVPPTSFTHCITKEDVEKGADGLVPKNAKETDCKYTDVSIKDGTVSWKVACPSKNVTGEGKMTYKSESYTGTVHMKMGEMEMNQKFTGKRVGDCDAK